MLIGSAELAEDDLRQRDGEVQEEDADENAADFACKSRLGAAQNTRAVGIGHQRTCTLPMM